MASLNILPGPSRLHFSSATSPTSPTSTQRVDMGLFGSVKDKFFRRESNLSSSKSPSSPRSRSWRTTGEEQAFSGYAAQSPSQSNNGYTYPTNNTNPFTTNAPPTRRPEYPTPEAPPAYSPSNPLPSITASVPPAPLPNTSTNTTTDDRFAFLSTFDTIFLIDDSGSMAGRSWRETASALRSIAPVCTDHDSDGIDIHFLNHGVHQPNLYTQITSVETIQHIFNTVQPQGGTPTGIRLHQLLKPYLARYKAQPTTTKPLNIVVITDGVPSDDVESVIIAAAKKLDKMDAPAWQVGIQFFQVGNEHGAAAALQELDDGLAEVSGGVRDMVDTVPWKGGGGSGGGGSLSGDEILKVVLGAVNRRLDRKKI